MNLTELTELIAEYTKRAEQHDASSMDHYNAGNIVGQALATGSAETYERVVEDLKALAENGGA